MAVKKTKTVKVVSSKSTSSSGAQEKIQKKAYELFEKRGYQHGNDLSDWLEAEKIVKSNRG